MKTNHLPERYIVVCDYGFVEQEIAHFNSKRKAIEHADLICSEYDGKVSVVDFYTNDIVHDCDE